MALQQKRCLTMFLEAIGSPVTKKNYKYELDKFLKWNGLTDYDDLLKADEKSIQRNLEDYLIYLKGKHSANYIPVIMKTLKIQNQGFLLFVKKEESPVKTHQKYVRYDQKTLLL